MELLDAPAGARRAAMHAFLAPSKASSEAVFVMPNQSPHVANQPPWWLTDGQEVCQFCTQFYLLEMECRCVRCDTALCALCVADVTGPGYLCPNCDADSDRLE